MTQYPEDEFDRAARSRGPKGVHRPAEPTWKKLLPILAAIILGPLLAWGFISALNRDTGSDPVANPTATETTASPTAEPPEGTGAGEGETEGEGTGEGEGTSSEPTAEPEPELQVNLEAPVTIYNGARIAGIAGRTSARLEAEGFTSLNATDYNQAQPAATTIYYNNAELADTATRIGEILGISEQVELAAATESIAVILRSDFQE